jgi:hypothetical protein
MAEAVDTTSSKPTRIRVSKKTQYAVIDYLRGLGYYIDDPTFEEDTQDGIDFWWYMNDKEWHSVQLKQRQSGDDLIHEIVFNTDTGSLGRDVKGISDYTLWIDRKQFGRMVLTDYLRKLTKTQWLPTYRAKKYRLVWDGPFWQLWKVQEKGDVGEYGEVRWKVLAFVKPDPSDILWKGQFVL